MKLQNEISKLVDNFYNQNAWNESEDHIQTMFTIKLLELLGYSSLNIRINRKQEVKTGKKPDILLLNDIGNTIMVIESKDAKKWNKLDGHYGKKSFVEQLFDYSNAEGIYWGILTNFIEWRIYSVYQQRLYQNKKYAFHKLLWQGADKSNYIDLLSEEGIEFFKKISFYTLSDSDIKSRINNDPVYYPKQEEIKVQFFESLKDWRKNIRNEISKHYGKKYSINDIDIMTQVFLNRLIFIDYCADNNIIPQDKLHAILHCKSNIKTELKRIFKEMDDRFNSELFSIDECDKIDLDDNVLNPIITELSNIDFSKLSVNIIGEVYENYLGELLKTSKKGIVVDNKKTTNKKKAQGIYYTYDYIVNYIVENTVGVILKKCKTISEIQNIRVLDPACGSGSFLIRVFDEFLKHYERISPSGLFQFEIRKIILQNNIFGVDIDERAIEITKLNLLVKALEGSAYTKLTGERILPNIKLNIRCGNSLISGETSQEKMGIFYQVHESNIFKLIDYHAQFKTEKKENNQVTLFENILKNEYIVNEELNENIKNYFNNYKNINPANYSIMFPAVYKAGGFDCIVGNPPWGAELAEDEKMYFSQNIKDLKGEQDTYILFMKFMLDRLKQNGMFGFIVPDTWLTIVNVENIRKYIKDNYMIIDIYDRYKPFKYAKDTRCHTLILKKQKHSNYQFSVKVSNAQKQITKSFDLPSSRLENTKIWNLYTSEKENKIFLKMKKLFKPLRETDNFIVKYGLRTGKNLNILSNSDVNNLGLKIARGSNIERYYFNWKPEYLVKTNQLPQSYFSSNCLKEKIIVQYVRTNSTLQNCRWLEATLIDKPNFVPLNSTNFIYSEDVNSLKYLLGILCSNLLNYYYKSHYTDVNVKTDYLKELPIPSIHDNVPLSNKIIKNVDLLLNKQKLFHKSNESIKIRMKSEIEALEQEIDNLVYELYQITTKEKNYIQNIIMGK